MHGGYAGFCDPNYITDFSESPLNGAAMSAVTGSDYFSLS